MRLLLLCITLTLLTSVSAEVYRVIDEDGNVIFSDKPSPGAEEVKIEHVQTISPPEVKDFKYTPSVKNTADGVYTSLEIVSPENDQIFTGNTSDVIVDILIQPALNKSRGDRLILTMDGMKQADSTSTSFSFSNLDKGIHTTKVVIVDKDGRPLKSSATVSFTINRHSDLKKILLSPPAP
jgi:hypothetical protein